MIEVRKVKFVEILDAANSVALLEEYAAECSVPEIGPIAPQRDIYAMLERHDAMQCFGAFDGYNLVGFANVIPDIIPHYGKKVAKIESLFVPSDRRKYGGAGTKLKAAVKAYARETGCVGVFYTARIGSTLESILDMTTTRTHAVFYEAFL